MGQNAAAERKPPFSRSIKVDEIPGGGMSDQIEANAEERAAMANLLDLVSLALLEYAFELKPTGVRGLLLNGRLRGRLTQHCVVSLEHIDIDIDTPLDVEFVSEKEFERRQNAAEDELSDPDGPDVEPILGGEIDLGQLAYESLATELEPYPRKKDADFRWEGAGTGDEDEGPFAALKELKEK